MVKKTEMKLLKILFEQFKRTLVAGKDRQLGTQGCADCAVSGLS